MVYQHVNFERVSIILTKNVVINGVEDVRLIEETVDPKAVSAKECLIESEVSLISAGTELSRVFGLKKGAVYPVRPGYCSVGKILAIGDDLAGFNVGDRVLFNGPHSSLQFYDPSKSDGGVLFKLREETSSIEGSFLMMCWIAMNGILPADVKLGNTVAILGMGTLGLILSIYYQQMGVEVIALEPITDRAELAKSIGVNHVINCAPNDQYESVMEITEKKGVDIVVDATGLSESIETAIKIAGKYGQVILMGSPRTDYTTNVTNSFNAIHTKMLTVNGAFNRRYPYQEKEGSRLSIHRSLKYIESLLNKKIIDVDRFISHVIAPTEENLMEAYDGLMNKKNEYTGVIIDWNKKEDLA